MAQTQIADTEFGDFIETLDLEGRLPPITSFDDVLPNDVDLIRWGDMLDFVIPIPSIPLDYFDMPTIALVSMQADLTVYQDFCDLADTEYTPGCTRYHRLDRQEGIDFLHYKLSAKKGDESASVQIDFILEPFHHNIRALQIEVAAQDEIGRLRISPLGTEAHAYITLNSSANNVDPETLAKTIISLATLVIQK